MGQADRWRPSLCFSSPLTPLLLTHRAGKHQHPPAQPLPEGIWHHIHAIHIRRHTAQPGPFTSANPFIMWETATNRGLYCYSWHEWVWMSAASVVDWFSIRIDWTKWALGSIAVNELLLRQPHGRLLLHTCPQWVERRETVPFIQDYCINQWCATTARKTHIFHIAVQTHSMWTEMDKRIMNGNKRKIDAI